MRRDWSDLRGVTLSPGVRHVDARGAFAKLLDTSGGPSVTATQVCTSANLRRGTLRGIHVQIAPYVETKRLWCSAGAVWDVVVDTRPDEPTYGDWAGLRLDAEQAAMVTIPPGVAHAFQTLTDDASLVYLIDGQHAPEAARTLRWDDPTVAVEWPCEVTVVSDADRAGRSWPLS